MGLFSFAKDAGSSLFGGKDLDENKIRDHLVSLNLGVNPLSVVANPKTGVVSLIGKAASLAAKEKVIVAAGNIKGVESVDDRIRVTTAEQPVVTDAVEEADQDADSADEPPADEAPTAKFYTVERGDTLGKIAKQQYGDAGKYPIIFEANKPMLSDPDKIYPGQTLRIPPLED